MNVNWIALKAYNASGSTADMQHKSHQPGLPILIFQSVKSITKKTKVNKTNDTTMSSRRAIIIGMSIVFGFAV